MFQDFRDVVFGDNKRVSGMEGVPYNRRQNLASIKRLHDRRRLTDQA